MTVKRVLQKTVRLLFFTALGIILLVCGTVSLLYSPWTQEKLCSAVNTHFSRLSGGGSMSLNSFKLRFPLRLELAGLLIKDSSDTLIAARTLKADVSALPLFTGKAYIDEAILTGARYRMGGPDSAMFMTIAADSIALVPASVRLSDMNINLEKGLISGGRLSLFMKPDTSTTETKPSEPTKMSIDIDEIDLKDFTYVMRMMPTIDTLSAHIPQGKLNKGSIDLYNQKIKLCTFTANNLDARYIAPDSAAIAASGPYPVTTETSDTPATKPWTITIDSIGIDSSHALYATAGVTPLPGLDFSYIEADNLSLGLHDFYNQQSIVKLPLRLSATERCGVSISASGLIDINDSGILFKNFTLNTPDGTDAKFSGELGSGDLTTDPNLPLALNLDGAFAPSDMSKMFPTFMPYFAAIPSADDIRLQIDAEGTSGNLDIANLDLRLNDCVSMEAHGNIVNMMQPEHLGGHIDIKGNIINVTALKNAALDPATAKTIAIPPLTISGNIDMADGTVAGRIGARTKDGNISMDGRWNSRLEKYTASLKTNDFPVNAFMPLLGVGSVTASINADGRGYNPFKKSTVIDASLDISKAVYEKKTYTDIEGTAKLADGKADIELNSTNQAIDFSLSAQGNLDGKVYSWTANLDGRNIDLQALNFSNTPASIEISANATAEIGPGKNDIKAHIALTDLFFRQLEGTIALSDIDAHLDASDSLTNLTVTNRDLAANFSSDSSIDSLASRFSKASSILSGQMADLCLDVDTLAKTLPPFSIGIVAGRSNLINDILAPYKMSIRHLSLNAVNDSSLTMDANIRRFATASMRLDSIYLTARQHADHLHLTAGIENNAGNMDPWHRIRLDGKIDGLDMSLAVHQQNLKGDTGFDIGLETSVEPADSTITLHIKPFNPTIGYQKWDVNEDNFISYRLPDRHIDANLKMTGGNSSLAILTEHVPSATGGDEGQEDLVVQLGNIHISDWISLNPFAPPIKGDINADMRLNSRDNMLIGKGSAGITNFFYGKQRADDFKADFDVTAGAGGLVHANAKLMVNGVPSITASGVLNDSTSVSPLGLDLRVIRFPLSAANPFIPDGMAKLSGTLNGNLIVDGTTTHPVANGALAFDSTSVFLKMTGTPYSFSNDSISVRNSVVNFKDFKIKACNDNPLVIDGDVDLEDFTNMRINLGMKAQNMQIVNTNRLPSGADIYGKGFINLDAKAHGSMALMAIDADLALLSGTNVTYVLSDATSTIANRSASDVVKFVNFEDSTEVAGAEKITRSGMAMFLDAKLTIEDGSIVTVDLAPTGNNKVQLQSNGTLSYSMTPLSAGRLVGRLNIDQGFVRYTPPFLGEKSFSFQNDSYVSFTGNMMNPNLNIHAYDIIKTNVTLEGQNSRMVNFNISLAVTGTLDHMNVVFDLSTLDDITIANELSSMTPQQRANQAMNLLLYGMYMGPGAQHSTGGAPTGALFSFLESRINDWAANTIKGVDLSFGIDQYDRTVNGSTSSAMTYSYQVSKSLFNDRFKIIVGGNYSSDANSDENFSQNLINDISFEYFLNAARTMYLRLFRHTGYESILEGEVTQTGVGFVYRRKLRRLGDMFLPPKVVKRRLEKQNQREQELLHDHKDEN